MAVANAAGGQVAELWIVIKQVGKRAIGPHDDWQCGPQIGKRQATGREYEVRFCCRQLLFYLSGKVLKEAGVALWMISFLEQVFVGQILSDINWMYLVLQGTN